LFQVHDRKPQFGMKEIPMVTPNSSNDNRKIGPRTAKAASEHPAKRDPVTIRLAKVSDVAAITDIFNHAIANTTASFYREPRTVEQRTEWLGNRPIRYQVLVAESPESSSDPIVGWAAMDPWSEKHGYRITTEISYYVDPNYHGQGIGSQLIERLIESARRQGFKNLLAKICENNLVSLQVAQRFDFECVGTLRQIGEKFGTCFDVHYYQLQL